MIDHIRNKAFTLTRQSRAENVAQSLLRLAHDPATEEHIREACRGLAGLAHKLADGAVLDGEKARLRLVITDLRNALQRLEAN